MNEAWKSVALKVGTVTCNVATLGGFALSLSSRTVERAGAVAPSASVPGPNGLATVIYLGLLCAGTYSVLWTVAERLLLKTNYGAGGEGKLPYGWSAAVLSLCLTLSLALVPFMYQRETGVVVLAPDHWRAVYVMILLGAVAHLMMYGTSAKPNGISHRLGRSEHDMTFEGAVYSEAAYSVVYFGLIVLPYRMIASPNSSLWDVLLRRAALPGLVFFLAMTLLIALRYPGSLNDPRDRETRGVLSGLFMMFCFCGGMFV